MLSAFTASTCRILLGIKSLRLFKYSLEKAVGPEDLDLPLQLLDGPGVLALQLLLHVFPAVFDGAQIRAIPWPVNDGEGLVRKILFDALAGVTGCAIVEEVCGSVDRHERYQVVFQHLLISCSVHRGVFGQKRGPHGPQLRYSSPRPSRRQDVSWSSPCTGR
jgi:hypothetical protein